MTEDEDKLAQSIEWPDLVRKIRARTPARLLTGRSGAAYRSSTQMELREAHAAARDAVRVEFDLSHDLGADVIRKWNVFEVCTEAASKDEYLLRPDLGRRVSQESRLTLSRCVKGADVQIVIGDGLSVTAVARQVPALLPLLQDRATARGWTVGSVFAVRYCRVGILNEIGELLNPRVVVLLIGERPGLATAESLSAYLAYQPKAGDTDAKRNLIANIHALGVGIEEAATRIVNLSAAMMQAQNSGFQLREELGRLERG
jgi:ethanolamine ammonia-lyase small subunit